ncbi:MAG: hypothetical protein IJM90_01625 [Firmicutes bacterium]|nr:hypothetical protein [Bacillota bacterium]
MVIGNILTGLGVAIFKMSTMGNDPFSGMMMAVSAKIGMSYPLFQICLNLVFFAVQLAWARRLIGIGTILNMLFLGYLASFWYSVMGLFMTPPAGLAARLILVAVGVIVCSLGLSMYQLPDVGVAPYDSLALILDQKLPRIPYFWCRIFVDGMAALACYLAGGIVGVGTLVCAFGLGPFIQFFNTYVTCHLLKKKGAASADE